MTTIITLDQVKARLRFDSDIEDDDLTLMIEQATALVLNYLKTPDLSKFETGSPPSIPDAVTNAVSLATILLVGYLSRNRDCDPDKDWTPGYLPIPVMNCLYPLRDPAFA